MGLIKEINSELTRFAVDIASLKPDPKNARLHSEENIKAIMKSLEEVGQQTPIIHFKGVVLKGNGTLEAAKRLGWKKIAALPFEGNAKKQKFYKHADNRTAEMAEWDSQLLAVDLEELKNLGYQEELEEIFNWKPDETVSGIVGQNSKERLEIFQAATIKQIVLYFSGEEYTVVIERMEKIKEENSINDNTALFLFLLKSHEDNKSKNQPEV